MIYITLTDEADNNRIQLNIEAIGFFRPHERGTMIYITGGTGGAIIVQEAAADITERLKNLGCEFG